MQFNELAEPFLLLNEIESQLRYLVDGVFTLPEIRDACNEIDGERKNNVESISDFTLGECVRLLEKKENWSKLGFKADKVTFCKELDAVRATRNDVMHFDPDGILEAQLIQLRQFSQYLLQLCSLHA